ncbi:MAG: hypothetical protein O7B99_09730, partial [Planctomycetota bacterium]|nr:hypothetical protein [Planctomycetota bacterium]
PWRSGRDLMRAALDRAILYDVWPRPAGLDLEILAAARRDPLAQTWLDTLGAALGEELSADPLARAWLGWRR